MKNTIVSTIAIGLLSATASAQLTGKALRRHNHAAKSVIGDASEFGVLADKFREHQRLTSGGGGRYYAKSESRLRAEHSSIYRFIQLAVTEDRISEEDARDAVNSLLAVGTKHLAVGDAANTEQTSIELSDIRKSIKIKMTDRPPEGIITPKINRLQFHMEEVIRFGEATDRLSSGSLNTLHRKLDSLEAQEEKAKARGTISDRDHEKLLEKSREIWKDALGKF